MVRRQLRQIGEELRRRSFLDLYTTTVVAFGFAALLLVGADLPGSVRWSLLLAAVGFLLLWVALADHRKERFLDRSAYDRRPISDDGRAAKDVRIFAPGGRTSSPRNAAPCASGRWRVTTGRCGSWCCGRSTPDPIFEQLDALLDHPVQGVASSLRGTHTRLQTMIEWQVNGTFGVREIGFNPGFSIVAIDPQPGDRFANFEFHGSRNDAIGFRMHIQLIRGDGRWFKYWLEQSEKDWHSTLSAGK